MLNRIQAQFTRKIRYWALKELVGRAEREALRVTSITPYERPQ